ncbi:MAG: MFS transporter [Metallosphaera sp.]|uniref:MFS transporter n=1 Tax=Metallosphaera sp. TaxID=2020860 RepID=UPI00316E56BD
MRPFLIFVTSSSFFLGYFARIAWSIVSVYSTLRPTEIQDSVIFSLFFLGYVIVQIPSGMISDRRPREVVILALIGLAISSFLSGFSTSILQEYMASLLMGLSAGWIYPVTIKILASSFDRRELPVAIGYYSLAWPLSIILAGLTLPYLSINIGWRYSYYMISLLCVIVALLYLKVRVEGGGNSGKLQLIKDRNVIAVSMAGFLFFLSYWIITLYAYKYFLKVGLNGYEAGIAYSFLAVAGIPSTVIAGYLIRRMGVRTTLSTFEGFYGVLTILLSFLVSSVSLFIISFLMGFVRFVITPANSSAVSLIDKGRAGSVSGFANFFWQSSGIVAPLLASLVVIQQGYHVLWIVAGVVILLSAVLYRVLLRIER